MGQAEQLDLIFLATGTWQHVFVQRGDTEKRWVYKIPSAFGYLLPFVHPQRLRPQSRPTQAGDALLARLPLGERLLASRLRRLSLAKFNRMLVLIEEVERHGLSDILLPCDELHETTATLEIEGQRFTYRGVMLRQRRADYLFESNENLHSFEWTEIVEAHHRLWRCGITFSTTTAVLELKNWALLDGRLRLFDTSSLTSDRRVVTRALGEEELNKREQSVLRKVAERQSSEPFIEYFRFIRRELNRDKLEQLWRADLNFKH
ncbi:MAG TPA: hypothetical protein VM911_21850 [Pyrinomonadaceae bacterium]|nr:hypothetical protein [Pyrinomonadaceae bacterium]